MKHADRRDPGDASPEHDSPVSIGPGEYNAVVANAQLVDVLLIGCNFKMAAKYFEVPSRDLHFALEKVSILPSDDSGTARGAFQWVVRALSDNEAILEISATFVAIYASLNGQSVKAVESFVRRLGPFTTYPYFRSHVSELRWMSKANLPLLPVLTEASLASAVDSDN
jgi:hypothetical protein